MEIVQKFINGFTSSPFRHLMDIFTLGPDSLLLAFGVIALVFFLVEFLKCYLMIAHTRSLITHVSINLFTLLPAFLIMAILFYAGYSNPERAWINLFFAISAFVPWYLAATATRLSRSDVEGADLGFMTVGFAMVFSAGFIAILVF